MSGQVASYVHRKGALTPSTIYEVGDRGLEVRAEAQPIITLPWSEVSEVRLSYAPNRFQSNCYRCDVKSRGAKVWWTNINYAGPLSLERQTPAYLAFVKALHQKLAAEGRGVRFRTGITRLQWWGWGFVFSLLVVVGLAVFTFFPTADKTFRICLLVSYGLFVVFWLALNRPGSYSPEQLPESLLPRS